MFWAVAWRLKALHDRKQLTQLRAHRSGPRSRLARGAWLSLGCLLLLTADIPLCRLNYNLALTTSVSIKKTAALRDAAACEGTLRSSASGRCAEFCEHARELSEERLACILWARKWHILGRFAAQLFDDARGVEQGTSRIDDLFKRKSCADVLRSVDKSNTFVNYGCYILAGVSIIGAFTAFSHFLGPGSEAGNHED